MIRRTQYLMVTEYLPIRSLVWLENISYLEPGGELQASGHWMVKGLRKKLKSFGGGGLIEGNTGEEGR